MATEKEHPIRHKLPTKIEPLTIHRNINNNMEEQYLLDNILRQQIENDYNILDPLVQVVLKNMDKQSINLLYNTFNLILQGVQKNYQNYYLNTHETKRFYYYILNIKWMICKHLQNQGLLWYLQG